MDYSDIQKRFIENSNPVDAQFMRKYMRNKFYFYGIKTAFRRELYKDIIREARRSKIIDWNLLEDAWNDTHREAQYFVTDYLKSMREFLTYEDIKIIDKYARDKQRWDSIDVFDRIIGSIGLRDPKVSELMLKYSKDKNFWIRRLSIDHQLDRKEKTDKILLRNIILNNLRDNYINKDEEFFINKAIGRSLREYSKTNPKRVRDFIYNNKEKMSKLSIREATKYI